VLEPELIIPASPNVPLSPASRRPVTLLNIVPIARADFNLAKVALAIRKIVWLNVTSK
jgi:hypothetical protein